MTVLKLVGAKRFMHKRANPNVMVLGGLTNSIQDETLVNHLLAATRIDNKNESHKVFEIYEDTDNEDMDMDMDVSKSEAEPEVEEPVAEQVNEEVEEPKAEEPKVEKLKPKVEKKAARKEGGPRSRSRAKATGT